MSDHSQGILQMSEISTLPIEDLFNNLETSEFGLTDNLALEKLKRFGPNSFDTTVKKSPFLQYLQAFLSPLPIMLIILAGISFITGEGNGAIVIALMVLLSTSLAFFQEYRSNNAAEKLKALIGISVKVKRNGVELEIPLHEVVPGDIILLSAGDLIPADLRITQSKDLYVNQSSLTGEAMPVEKFERNLSINPESPFDLQNICFMGSYVVSGIGIGVVTHTAINTYFGKIAKEVGNKRKVSSFDKGIQKFIWLMIRVMLAMVPLVFLINGFVKHNWMEALLFATAVAVGLTPELLPLLVTINLAKGAIVMSKKKVIVKHLDSIQNLGAMNILCTDKTGTLTQDRIILEKFIDVFGNQDERVLDYAYLNSHYQSGLRNLLDEAVLKHVDLHEKLHDENFYQKIDEIPFDFQRKRMSVILKRNNKDILLICKGAIEEVAACCSYVQIGENQLPFNKEKIHELQPLLDHLNGDGFRVIAVAIKSFIDHENSYSTTEENNLTLLGYVAFLDPPKETARPAIEKLLKSGVMIKILTGDNELVTRKICNDVGLSFTTVLLGSQIDNMSDDELGYRAEPCSVFAKLTPQQKSRIIQVLQSKGNVVGFMGDGINDGPALKTADVSVSVDTAVDIAKDSADIILLEKSLLVLHEGVLEGRKVFGNIMKYIKMSASSNFGNMFSMIGASAMLPFLPMAPVQILLNNFLYDCSQTSVPSDSVDEEYLSKPRVWDIGNVARFMFYIGPVSSLFDYATFGLLWFVVKANSIELSSVFQTGWFVESLVSQTLIVHIIRTGKIPFIESKPSTPLLLTTISICAIGIYLPFTSIGEHLQMQPLPSAYWIGLFFILIAYFGLTQFLKSLLVKRFGL